MMNPSLKALVESSDDEVDKWKLRPIVSVVNEARRSSCGPTILSQQPAELARFKKRHAIMAKVQELEDSVMQKLATEQALSEKRLSTYLSCSSATTDYEEAKAELTELKEQGVAIYLEVLDRADTGRQRTSPIFHF
jgi:hypothetical protein